MNDEKHHIPLPPRAIEQAETPPGTLYTDPSIYAHQIASTFRRSWQFIGDRSQAPVPRSHAPITLLEGSLNEPLLLVRDDGDSLRCVSNVCTHRAMLVCESAGVSKSLTCRYHGRRFNLDGTFKSMPEFEAAEDFPRPCDNLAQSHLDAWGPLLFTSLDPAIPFDSIRADLEKYCGFCPLDDARFDAQRSRDYLVRCNWALYVENYLEGFHIPYVHASLAETLDYGEYTTERFQYTNLQVGIASGSEDLFDLPTDHPLSGKNVAAFYFWLFPNTMVNVYPWGISMNVVRPLAVDRTRVSFLSYVWDDSKLDQGAGADLDRVEREDEALVEQVQKGLGSRLYKTGRYSPAREQNVHHFHRLLISAIQDPESVPQTNA